MGSEQTAAIARVRALIELEQSGWEPEAPEYQRYVDALADLDKLAAAPPTDCRVDEAMVARAAALSTTGRQNDPKYRAKIRRILEAALSTRLAPVDVPVMPGNWPEDASHENGDYECACVKCKATFYGHKRRAICKLCAAPVDGLTEGELAALDRVADDYWNLEVRRTIQQLLRRLAAAQVQDN